MAGISPVGCRGRRAGDLRVRLEQQQQQDEQHGHRTLRPPAKTGGTLTVLDVAGGVDSLDPGYWYYQTDYSDLGDTTQRQLYGWPPNADTPVPDLATALPAVSDGGKTLTIHIKPGIHYSAPLASRDGEERGHQVRDGAVLRWRRGQRLRRLVLRPHRRRAVDTADQLGARHLGTADAGRHDARDQADPAGWRALHRSGADAAVHDADPAVLCGEVRQGRDAVLRAAPGVRRSVHDQGRRLGHGPAGGLHRQQGPRSRSQPELGGDQVDRLPPRLRRRDRDQGGLPARGRFAEDPQRLRPAER